MAAVSARQSKIGEQPRDALIEHGNDCRGRPCCRARRRASSCDAGWPADQKVGVVVNPLAFDQHRRQVAVEATRGAIVEVLDAGLLAQLGVLQPLREPLVGSQ